VAFVDPCGTSQDALWDESYGGVRCCGRSDFGEEVEINLDVNTIEGISGTNASVRYRTGTYHLN
jgi:hypothetical protein